MARTETRLKGDAAAHELLRRTHAAGYRYAPGFGGFSADLYYARDGESWSGTVEARSPRDIRYGGNLEDADERLGREVSSVVGHRWGVPYEESDGRFRLSLDPGESPLGRLVRVEDDGMDSRYRIQGGHITQIERRVGERRFLIHIQERSFTGDGRALPIHFCAVYWDVPGGHVVRTDIYRDGYISLKGVYLPLSRRIITAGDGGITTRQILFRNHELLGETSSERKAV